MSNAAERKTDFSKKKVFVMNPCVRVACQIDECHQKMAQNTRTVFLKG